MDTKKTILIYQHAERIKSELIIASRLMARLDSLKGEERKGAEIMMTTFLEALLGEIRIGRAGDEAGYLQRAEEKVIEASKKLTVFGEKEVNRCISEALSAVTTVCQRAMEELVNQNLF